MHESPAYCIGITGNIACGKSLVTGMLEEVGAATIDADRVAHEIMVPGNPVMARIAERFGNGVIAEDGTLDRAALGNIVFSDPQALTDLEAITHPATVRTILQRARESQATVVVVDAIKLFESGLADHCDEIWTVYCEPEEQLRRLMERNQISEAEARKRIDAQPPQDEKRERSTHVIDNSDSVAETRRQVEHHWRRIMDQRARH